MLNFIAEMQTEDVMKKWMVLLIFFLLMLGITGCMFDKKDLLAGFEQPDVIIENINKNLDGPAHQFTKIKEHHQWLWRMENGFQLSIVQNSYAQGVSLLLCYDAESMDEAEAGSILAGILKIVEDDDSRKVIEQLQLANDDSVEVAFGNYIIQKVSAKNLTIEREEAWSRTQSNKDDMEPKATFDLPVHYIRIERKLDKDALDEFNDTEYLESVASLDALKNIIRRDENLREASRYFREEVKQEGEKPAHLEQFKFAQ